MFPLHVTCGDVIVIRPPSDTPPEEREYPWLGLVTATTGSSVQFDWIVKLADTGKYVVGVAEPRSDKTSKERVLAKFGSKIVQDIQGSLENHLLTLCFPQ